MLEGSRRIYGVPSIPWKVPEGSKDYVPNTGGVHNGGQFKVSSLYRDLRNRDILQSPIVNVRRKRCTPYLIGDSAYPIRPYLQKNWKSPQDEDKKRY